MKRYFLKEFNTTAGLDRASVDGDNDDRFKAVRVKTSIFFDHDSSEVFRSRLRRIILSHREKHDDSVVDNKNAIIRSNFTEEVLSEEAPLTKKDLDVVERYADNLFHTLGIDVTFTRHFLDRANDSRNGKPITIQELITLFNRQYTTNGAKIKKMPSDTEAVLKDMKSDINTPVYLEYDRNSKMLEMRCKTTMRKKNFHTPDPIFKA